MSNLHLHWGSRIKAGAEEHEAKTKQKERQEGLVNFSWDWALITFSHWIGVWEEPTYSQLSIIVTLANQG